MRWGSIQSSTPHGGRQGLICDKQGPKRDSPSVRGVEAPPRSSAGIVTCQGLRDLRSSTIVTIRGRVLPRFRGNVSGRLRSPVALGAFLARVAPSPRSSPHRAPLRSLGPGGDYAFYPSTPRACRPRREQRASPSAPPRSPSFTFTRGSYMGKEESPPYGR
jgi:hypothetical protein